MPQQRKLVIVRGGEPIESEVVTLSDKAEKELKKAVDQAKAHGGEIASVDLVKP